MLTPPIPVLLPLLAAVLLAAVHRVVPRWLAALLAIAAALAVACVAVSMVVYSRDAALVVWWFGGSSAHSAHVERFAFVFDTSAAMLVLLSGALSAMAMIFAFRASEAGAAFYAWVLVFLGAANGVCVAGDLLGLFVFFAVMAAAARSLCAACRFSAVNIAGGFLMLAGIAVLFLRTGAINMASLGRALGSADAVVPAAFALIAAGLLIHTAMFPFHFWLADAVNSASAPVAALIAGMTVELALYAVTRIWWVVFSGALQPYENVLGHLLAVLGAATAAVGAAACFAESDLKRLLAYSVIGHAGIMLIGIALWAPGALAGVELYGVEQALLHGALFLAAGVLLFRTGSLQECDLHGRGRRMPGLGALFFLGAAGLAGLPPFATFWGDVLLDGAAARLGYGWGAWLAFLTEAVMAAALVRFALRVFAGWGASPVHERPAPRGHAHAPFLMYASTAVLILLSAVAGLAPRLTGAAESAAIYMEDRAGYAQRVLDLLTPYPPTVSDVHATAPDLARSLGAAAVAFLLAWVAISPGWRRACVRIRFLHHFAAGFR